MDSKLPRSGVVTALASLVILASAAVIPISFISLLMMIVGSDGTGSATLLGFVNVVIVPPVTFVAGIGLLRRKPWARYYLLALFTVVLAYNLYAFVTANPEATHYVSPSGVPTTVLPTDRSMFVPIIAVCLAALAVLVSRRARIEFAGAAVALPATVAATVPPSASTAAGAAPKPAVADESRDWRVGHVGIPRAPSSPGQKLAALLAVTLLFALAGVMTWFVYDGVVTGETTLPSKMTSHRRPVLRADEPISFWVSIGLYASVAIGSVGLVAWGFIQTRRGR